MTFKDDQGGYLVPHQRFGVCGIAVLLIIAVLVSPSGAVAPSETLLPDSTKGYLSVTNMKALVDHWNQTQIGKLMKDPIMEPFRKDLERQFEQQWMGAREKLGFSIDDLRGIPAGEVAVALIQPAPGQAAMILLADVTGNQQKAEGMLKKVGENLIRQGAAKKTEKAGDTSLDVFDLPKHDPKDQAEPKRQAVYLVKSDLLIVTDSVAVARSVLDRLAKKSGACLADVAAFRAVMERCKKDAGEAVPQIRWFLDPFGYVDTARTYVPERDRPRGKKMLDTLRTQGFEAIRGVGGQVSFATEGYELIHRTAVHAPPPYEKSMKMLVFPNHADFAPQPWVPRDIATYMTGYVDIANAFDNFGPMFDELFGEGETGVWDDVLEGLEKDKHGPQINLKKELIDQLENQVTVVTDYELPITTSSERILIAIKVRDEPAVAKALEKMLKADDTVQMRVLADRIIWEAVPREKPQVPSISLVMPGEEPISEDQSSGRGAEPVFPNAAITVANGQLYIASHLDFLVKILQDREQRETLGATVDFQVIGEKVERFGSQHCAWVFSRTDQEYRATYELIRAGKMPESETMLGRTLNTLFGAGRKGVLRQQEIDGSKLPEFEVVRRYLGTAGSFGVSEDSGWFLKGFMLSEETK